jgi:hypothetical protein
MSSFYQDASLVMIPSGYKDQKIYCAKPTDGSADLTFSRASSATRVASNGLIEKVRTNLILQSNSFNTSWSNIGSSEVSGQPGYDGTNNAWSLVEDSAGGTHALVQIPSTFGLVTISVYAKAGTRDWLFLRGVQGGLNVRAWFNLSTGTIGTVEANGTAKIESVGNGWYRCSLTVASFQSGFEAYVAISSADTIASYTGNGTGNILIQNAQYETGDIATDYIATTTAAVSVGPVSGLPRLDYLGSTCPRLLLEPQRTNLSTDSETFAASTGTTISLNNTASPDGYVNADKLVENTSTGVHQTSWATSLGGSVDSSAYCISVFAKAAGRSRIFFFDNNQNTSGATTFDLSTGTIVSGGGKIENYGSGWYRCTIFPIKNFSTTSSAFVQLINTGTTTSYTGDGTSGIFLWGKQTEAGAYATSYIPTLGASVTRVADAASKTGISSLIGQTQGTLFVDLNYEAITGLSMFLSIRPNSTNKIEVYRDGQTIYGDILGNSVAVLLSKSSSPAGRYKIALAYKSGQTALYVNGTSVGTSSTAFSFASSMEDLFVNLRSGGTFVEQAFYNQVLLFKTRLTNAQMQELTSL